MTEKKVNENVKVEEVKENKEPAQADVQNNVTEVEEDDVKLTVERRMFKGSDGKDYWAYETKGKVRNRDVKVDFAPKDKGGYEVLDIVFDVSPTAELIITNETMTDSISGRKTKYTSYKVRTTDEFGMDYECNVKPSQDSDKSLLTMLLNQLKANSQKV